MKSSPPDPTYRKKVYLYRGRKVRVTAGLYPNGWLAVSVSSPRSANYEALTVNLEDMEALGLPANTFVDCNKHPEALAFLIKNKLARDAKYKRLSGFVEYPMVFVDLALLYQHDPETFQEIHLPFRA